MIVLSSDVDSSASASSPQEVSEQLLRRDVRVLGFELGRIMKRLGSAGLFDLVEEIRQLAKQRRTGDAAADAALRQRIAGLSLQEIEEVIRALSCFFDLANLAEDRHRIRVLRHREQMHHPAPRNESIGAAIDTLQHRHFTAQRIQELLDELSIELVFTAHPTEAKRRTVRNTLRRLRADLIQIDRPDMLPRERDWLLSRIKSDLACLWETDTMRPCRPTVLEEVRRSLFVADSVWDVVPWLYRAVRSSLERNYPGQAFELPVFCRFGTWIGGDRDGNPNVTAEVTQQSLRILRTKALEKHLEQCQQMASILTISQEHHPVRPELAQALKKAQQQWPAINEVIEELNPHEVYRHWLTVIEYRLQRTVQVDPFAPLPDAAYAHPQDLRRDLDLLAHSLRANGHDLLADGQLQDWLDRVAVFGFHLSRMDIREDSSRLEATVAELMLKLGVTDSYTAMDEVDKQSLLTTPVDEQAVRSLSEDDLSDDTRETFRLFVLIQQTLSAFGKEALGTFVISMTRQPSDTLSVQWLSELATRWRNGGSKVIPMPIAPLFETIDDLRQAGDTLEALLSRPAYAKLVKATGNLQICMVGYSDSTKDGGNLAANWSLYQAEEKLAEVAAKHGVQLMLFHGRGGALGRGGGPAARGILSLPPQSVRGKLRMTEQGEVLAERYDDPQIAFRHIEQVAWATLLVSAEQHEQPQPRWRQTLDIAAESSLQWYRKLVTDPDFVQYFDEATPINSIETLPIGSRPARRRGQRKLENLRAIPYTFAWTQSRHMVTAFFGLGTGLTAAGEAEGWATLRQMYKNWPFFRAVIDNAELALAKADMSIAKIYAELVSDGEAGDRLWQVINEEYGRSRDVVLKITGRSELLDDTPWLQRSIRVRNPYVDPLNIIQSELMHRLRSDESLTEAEEDQLAELLRLSVQGVSAGLRTTG